MLIQYTDLSHVMQCLYDSEINVRISSFWDGGFTAEIGDEMNGFKESKDCLYGASSVAKWLTEAALRHYPESVFAAHHAAASKRFAKPAQHTN